MIIFETIFDLGHKLMDAVVRSVAILGGCAFFVIIIVEGYLRMKEITQDYRRRIIHPPATNPCTDSCQCSCHSSTPNEEKQQ
jgi:hypothetical protein